MNLPLIPGSLPTGWCPTQGTTFWQEVYNKFFALGVAQLALGTGYTIKVSDTEPTAAERDNTLWYKLIGGVPDRIYYYYGGYWVCPHPVQDTSFLWMVQSGSEADIWALEGGDGSDPRIAGNVSDWTGAFWEVAHEFDFRIPIGPGTNPVTSTAIAIGATGGVEEVTLTTLEGAQDEDHFHTVGRQVSSSGSSGDDVILLTGTSSETGAGIVVHGDASAESKNIEDGTGAYVVTSGVDMDPVEAHTNMPPYVGVWFVHRTSRKFYTS